MEVTFRTGALARCYASIREAERTWGRDVARRYINRVDKLLAAEKLSELFDSASLRLHPLTGERAGQYAVTLLGRWRLVITVSPDQRTAIVEEVSNHYGD